jgi:DNA-binding response OmpR family regulator
MAFNHKDFDLSIITSGEELPAEMDRIRPDMVILDLNSPVVGAYDLCDKIKNDRRWSQTCVILVRKEFEKIDQDRLDTLNYDLMVFMPVQSREFEEKVRFILQQKRPLPGD